MREVLQCIKIADLLHPKITDSALRRNHFIRPFVCLLSVVYQYNTEHVVFVLTL